MNANLQSRSKGPVSNNKADWTVPPYFIIDYKKIAADIMKYWWLFLVTLALALLAVQIKHRYSQPVYRASLTILMDERGAENPQRDMMEGFGLSSAMQAIENQIAILRSWETIRQTIDVLDFHVSYHRVGRVKNSEIYGNFPFLVHFDSLMPQLLNTPIYLSVLDENRFRLHVHIENAATFTYGLNRGGPQVNINEFTGEYNFNEWITLPWLNIKIENRGVYKPEERSFFFQFHHPDALTSHYQARLSIPKPANNASIISISVTGTNNYKNITFLNALASVFIKNNLDHKNQIATNTISFIEDQLVAISDSLMIKGDELSRFRTLHQVQDINEQAGGYISRISDLDEQQVQLYLQREYLDYLVAYFNSDSLWQMTIAPAYFPVNNPIIDNVMGQIVNLNLDILSAGRSANPYTRDLEAQVEASRQILLQAITNQKKLVEEEINRVGNAREQNRGLLSMLPEKERQLLDIERHFSLSNEVYTFLLRKRSEAQIQKASNAPDHTVLEAARPAGLVSPTINKDRQRAIVIALFIPVFLIFGKHLLNNKIASPEDVEKLTKHLLIGHVVHNKRENSNVVHNYPKSLITENFRKIRTRLEFLTSNNETPVIAVTSSMPGEGKTFCALNVASVYAISGKKTILLGFDLRKPGLNNLLSAHNSSGISNYLVGKATLDDIIQPTQTENLHVLTSGPIPPNPSELISSPSTKKLFDELRKRFDVIIVDTPPMDIVADGFLISRHVDQLIFLARQNYTIRAVFWNTVKQMQDEGITNIGILVNDIKDPSGAMAYKYGYKARRRYGYGYGYSSGQGYYED